MEGFEKEAFKTVDICNKINLPLADIQLKDNGEFLYIVAGADARETGFTSHNMDIFLKDTLGL